ncbi:MAG: AIR synthase-related protein, partial [Armatimonadota bacterium]|nr:AIR synthase-related protein [Armatimonadota bacterium]
LATVLLPLGVSAETVEQIFDQMLSACENLGISIIGGHTEITYDLKRPIIVGCMLGETDRSHLVTSSGARAGDDIVITKGIAIEGTAILAREAHDRLREMWFTEQFLKRAANFLFNPGISVVRDARIAVETAKINAMHDPTEGGLATGLMEIAEASGLGIEVDRDAIPVIPETQSLCRELGLDPLGLIASGCLIITISPSDTPRLLDAFGQTGIRADVIGKMMPKEYGLKMRTPRGVVDMPLFERDEIARFFEEI